MRFHPRSDSDPLYACENCATAPLEKFVVPSVTTMWHCPHCDLFQKGQMPDMSAYNRNYHDIYEPYRRRKLRTAMVRLNRIATYVSSGRPKLLDVGCSLGATVEGAVIRGWDAHGVDVSADAVSYCLDRGLSCTTTRGLHLPYPDETFDVVTAWHVIEHVPNVTDTLREWRRVLRPGGLLVMETPDTDCLKVKMRGATYRRYWKAEHIYAFTRRNFVPFVERARFEVLRYPFFGRLNDLSASMATYALTYQTLKGAMRAVKMSKAFQVFCRRPLIPDYSHDLSRAA